MASIMTVVVKCNNELSSPHCPHSFLAIQQCCTDDDDDDDVGDSDDDYHDDDEDQDDDDYDVNY